MNVRFEHRIVGGQHVITSPDTPELYSAHPDMAEAEKDAAVAVQAIERAKRRLSTRTAKRAIA